MSVWVEMVGGGRTTGLYSPAAHNESAVASGIRLRTTGLFSPAAHYESAVASGIRLRTTGLFSPVTHYVRSLVNRLCMPPIHHAKYLCITLIYPT